MVAGRGGLKSVRLMCELCQKGQKITPNTMASLQPEEGLATFSTLYNTGHGWAIEDCSVRREVPSSSAQPPFFLFAFLSPIGPISPLLHADVRPCGILIAGNASSAFGLSEEKRLGSVDDTRAHMSKDTISIHVCTKNSTRRFSFNRKGDGRCSFVSEAPSNLLCWFNPPPFPSSIECPAAMLCT